jgi:hypothetical protein
LGVGPTTGFIKATGANICFDSAVPNFGSIFIDPPRKAGEIFVR